MFYLETEYRDWETNPEMQRHRLHCQQFRKRLDSWGGMLYYLC